MDNEPAEVIELTVDFVDSTDLVNADDFHLDGDDFALVEQVDAADQDRSGPINWCIYERTRDGKLFALPWGSWLSEAGLESALEVRIGNSPWGPVLVEVAKVSEKLVGVYKPAGQTDD